MLFMLCTQIGRHITIKMSSLVKIFEYPKKLGHWILNSFNRLSHQHYLYIHIYILACLASYRLVCLYPINVKKAKPVGPKFL